MTSLNKKVFFPPLVLLVLTIVFSFVDNDAFIQYAGNANDWIIAKFGWLFSWATFFFLLLVGVAYFSPLGKVRIGGKEAKPFLSKWRWFAITLCTTIATGILFWGTAEPLFHLNELPPNLNIASGSSEAAQFSMAALFMHWTFTPYGIYTMAGIVFALSYYNLNQRFSLGAMVYPLVGRRSQGAFGNVIDAVCLFGLVAGMSASLGAGILTIMGGMKTVLGLEKSSFLLAAISLLIVISFVISAASGLMKGIRILSDINIKAFIALAVFVFVFGPTSTMLRVGLDGIGEYAARFFPWSLGLGFDESWLGSWTIFNWANWMAWAPITALFLGRLSLGYTVRNYIEFNLILPSLFGGFWMMIFGGTAIHFDRETGGMLYGILKETGAENVIYELLSSLPWSELVGVIFLIIVFISYVTAADSNTSAMSALSTTGISPENPEASFIIKVIWGSIIGVIAWVMIASVGIDGIKMTSILGGFPNLFLMLLVAASLVKLMVYRNKYGL